MSTFEFRRNVGASASEGVKYWVLRHAKWVLGHAKWVLGHAKWVLGHRVLIPYFLSWVLRQYF